jgi:preprotein translocase subunit SecD
MRSLCVLPILLVVLGCGQSAPVYKPAGEPKVRFALRLAKPEPFEGAEEVQIPEDRQKFISPRTGMPKLFVAKEVILTNADIASTSPVPEGQNQSGPVVVVELTPGAKEKFANFTKANTGEMLAIFFDGKLEMAPLLREQIAGGLLHLSAPELSKDALTRLAKGLVGQ